MQTVLTIAGFDPSSGAGVTADLMVFAAHGLFGTSAVTSLTVQSTTGVRSSEPVAAALLEATLDCLHADLPPAGVKIGMLGTAPIAATVAAYLKGLRRLSPNVPVVLDPVVRSSSGRELLSPEGFGLLRERLLPLVTWVTPNLDELGLLTNLPAGNRNQIETAAESLRDSFPELNILVTGGHRDPPDDLVLTAHGSPQWIAGTKVESRATHGTGCALSSALLSRLVLGDTALEAASAAKRYVAEAIRKAEPLGFGSGPLSLLWPLRQA